MINIPKYIQILDANNLPAARLSPAADEIKDCFADSRMNGESTLEFKIPLTSSKYKYIFPECKIWANDKEYAILKDEASDIIREKDNSLWMPVRAIESQALLDKDYVETYISNDPSIPSPADMSVIIVGGGSDLSGGLYAVGSAGHALYAVLDGNRYGWSVGTVDVTGTHDIETEKKSRLANINLIRDTWGGCLVFDSKNKLVHLRDEVIWQPFSGFQIRYRKNMGSITRTDNNDIVTRLYPFGLDNLDIASVNGGIKYVENTSYTTKIYVRPYLNNDISDAQELKDRAIYELAKICKPRHTYKSKPLDLRNLEGRSHETFSVCDMADVIDDELGTQRQRILRHKYNIFRPWECEVELGDPETRFIDTIKKSSDMSGTLSDMLTSLDQITSAYIKSLIADKIIAGKINISDLLTIENADGSIVITGNLIDITDGKIRIKDASGNSTILDQFGLDTKFIKWFKNMCYNSSFEAFDIDTLVPTYWDGGVSSSGSNFFGSYSLKLAPAELSTQTGLGITNPQYYNDVSTKTRVSFHKKGGATKIYVLDGAGAPITLTDKDGNTGTYIEFVYNANWVPESYSVSLTHGVATQIKVKFENSDVSADAYIDGVIIEPDYTGKRPSFYTDGPNSITVGTSAQPLETYTPANPIYVQDAEPTDAVEKDVWIDTDEYSRYDKTALTGTTTLNVADNEFITCSGTFTVTLNAGTAEGIIKKIYNIGTGMITIIGTINGTANMVLYPSESVELITDGANWRY